MPHVDEGQLHAYLDGELRAPGGDAGAIERHLAACAECRTRLGQAETIRNRARAILRGSDPMERPAPPFAAVAARSATPGTVRPRRNPRVLAAWAASVVLALGAGWYARALLLPPDQVASSAAPAEAAGRSAAANRAQTAAESVAGLSEAVSTGAASVPAPDAPLAAVPSAARAAPARARSAPPEPRAAADVVAAAPAAAKAIAELSTAETPTASAARAPASVSAADEAIALATGRVTDSSGSPVAGAQVYIPSLNLGTATRTDGTYTLRVPAARIRTDSLAMVAQTIGFQRETRPVPLHPGTTTTQDFQLKSATIALEAVVVTGQGDSNRESGLAGEETLSVRDTRMLGDEVRWAAAPRRAARRWLGGRVLELKGLSVTGIDTATVEGRRALRIRQHLPDGTTVTLVQTRERDVARPAPTGNAANFADAEPAEAVGTTGRDETAPTAATIAVRRSGITLVATAPIAPDSLRRVLARLH